jgi:hypothetical protein
MKFLPRVCQAPALHEAERPWPVSAGALCRWHTCFMLKFLLGLISSSRQLVHMPNNICKSGFMLPAGHSHAASWLLEWRQCSETCAKHRYFRTTNDSCLQNSCEFPISRCTEISVTPLGNEVLPRAQAQLGFGTVLYSVPFLPLPIPCPQSPQLCEPSVREEVKTRPAFMKVVLHGQHLRSN